MRKGTRVVYVPGNHDEFLCDYVGHQFGGVEIVEQAIHEAADGRRYLVIHGDQFDLVMRHARWLALMGDGAYTAALFVNTHLNRVRRRLGLTYWSLSAWAKLKVKNAVSFIGRYEEFLCAEARRHEVDGVVCGHIHRAEFRDFDGIEYWKDGDWVEGCNALVEHFDGRMEILHWPTEVARREAQAQAAALLAAA